MGHSVRTLKLDMDFGSVFDVDVAAAVVVVVDDAVGVEVDGAAEDVPLADAPSVLVESEALAAAGVEDDAGAAESVAAVVVAGAAVAVSEVAAAAVVEVSDEDAEPSWDASDSNACSTVFFMFV